MKKLLVVLLVFSFIFFAAQLSGQEQARKPIQVKAIAESYTTLMNLQEPTSDELDTMLNVAFRYLFYKLDTCMTLVRRADSLAAIYYPNEKIRAKTLYYLGDAYRVSSRWEEAVKVIAQGIEIYEAIGMESEVGLGYLKLGVIKTRNQEYEAAIKLHLQALEIFERLDDKVNTYKPYFEIAEVFFSLDQFQKALEYNGKAEAFAIENGRTNILVHALNNRATVENALALKMRDRADTTVLNQAALIDSVRICFENAEATMKRSLKLGREENLLRAIFHALNSLSVLNTELENYPLALEYGYEAKKIATEMGYTRFEVSAAANLTKALQQSGKYQEAIKRGEAALDMEAATTNPTVANGLHEDLYHAYRNTRQFEKALKHHEAYTAFVAEDQEAEGLKLVSEVEAKYQTVKQEKQIVELNASNAAVVNQRNNIIGISVALAILGFFGFQSYRILQQRNQKIAFSAALINAQETERKRIAQDLHDGVGQSLLLIKKQLSINNEDVQANQDLISATLKEVRSISQDLHPVLLEQFGFTATIDDMAQRIGASQSDLFVSTELDNVDEVMTNRQSVQLYRCIQEALNNVIKHSGATAAKIKVVDDLRDINISIQDNGRGFNLASKTRSTNKSLGLQTMRERMSSIGATFGIAAGDPKGTIIRIVIPKK